MRVFTAGHTFVSLRLRDYRLLCLGQFSTSMGQWMDQMTRSWLMYQITGSALQLGLATALRGLPLLFFGILAGAVADRSDRKHQLILAQVTNAILNVILATLVLLHRVQPWHVYATGFLAGTVQAFQQPARQTLISDIVGARHLMNALALNSMALNVSRAVGPALAGVLIALIGAHGSANGPSIKRIVHDFESTGNSKNKRASATFPTELQYGKLGVNVKIFSSSRLRPCIKFD